MKRIQRLVLNRKKMFNVFIRRKNHAHDFLFRKCFQFFITMVTEFLKLHQNSFLTFRDFIAWKLVIVLFLNNQSHFRSKKFSDSFITTYIGNLCCPPIMVFLGYFFNSVATVEWRIWSGATSSQAKLAVERIHSWTIYKK